jgi:hypothetical protein
MKGGYFEKLNAQVLSKNIKTSKEILSVVGGVVTTHKIPPCILEKQNACYFRNATA